MAIDQFILFFFISINTIILLFIGYSVLVGFKLKKKRIEKVYIYGVVILIGLTWVFPFILQFVYLIELDWFIYGYCLAMTFSFFTLYYFIVQIEGIVDEWESGYGDEHSWIMPLEAVEGKLSIIEHNTVEGVDVRRSWNILAPKQVLSMDWFKKLYESIDRVSVEEMVRKPSSKILKSIFKYIKGLRKKRKNEIEKVYGREISEEGIINELIELKRINKKYLFACRLYYWENQSINYKSKMGLKILKVAGWIGFILLFFQIICFEMTGEGLNMIVEAIEKFINLPYYEGWGQFALSLYKTASFSLMVMIGIYTGISAMTLVGFRDFGIHLKFPLESYRTGDKFIERLGGFAVTISLLSGFVFGLNVPFIFSMYMLSIFIVILVSTSIFVFVIFFLNAYGPHRMLVNTKIIWKDKLRELINNEKLYKDKPGIYERYVKAYNDIQNLREWTLAPPVLIKLVSSILIPVIIYFSKLIIENYLIYLPFSI